MAMGTNVFFEKDTNSVFGDPLYEPVCRQQYKYVNKSDKVISFDRVYIEGLPQDIKPEEEPQQAETKPQTLKLNITYKEAIELFADD